jgi:two-component system chemotaxis response regulator CheY
MMPNMDGIEALRQIRDMEEEHNLPSEKQAKIIMVTAVIDQLQKKSARALRCDDYITKPINRQDLTKKLKAFKLI